jgi:hypothetical protein
LPAQGRVLDKEDARHAAAAKLALEEVRVAQRGLEMRPEIGRHTIWGLIARSN